MTLSPVATLRAALAVAGLAVLGADAALADVPPPDPAVVDRGSRLALVFGFSYALTVLCEYLVVRASLAPRLAWRGPGRGHLLALVSGVNVVTLPLVFGVLALLGPRGWDAAPAIAVAEAIPFLGEPALYGLGFRRHVRRGNLEAAPPRASVWAATVLANVVSLVAGITVALGVNALVD
jgi:hypothetical protein